MGRGMEMDGCGKFIQILMFISNFIIWVGSILLLVLGIWAIVDRPYLETLMGEAIYVSAAYIIIAVGAFTFIISFLGCLGAIKEIRCMLLMYFIIVLLLFIVLLAGGILGFVFRGQAKDKIKMSMIQSMKSYKKNEDIPFTKAWDEAQIAMRCCGINDSEDWMKNNAGFKTGPMVPMSCCKHNSSGSKIDCTTNPNSENSYEEGCYETAKDFVKTYAIYIGIASIAVAILMIFGLVFSIILFRLIK